MNKSNFVNTTDLEKLSHFLKKPDITELNKILEFIEIFNNRTDNNFNNGIKINLSFDIPKDLKIPDPIEKVKKIRNKGIYFCEDCNRNFRDNFALKKHLNTKKCTLKRFLNKENKVDEYGLLDFN